MTHPYDKLTLGTADVRKIYREFIKMEHQLGDREYDIAMMTWSILRAFEADGRNTFVLNHNLVSMFDRTDHKAIDVSDLRFPFPTFFMKIEDVYVCFAEGEDTRLLCVFDDGWIRSSCQIPLKGNFGEILEETKKVSSHDLDVLIIGQRKDVLRYFVLAVQFIAFLNQCPESAVLDKDHEKRKRLRKSLKRLKGKKESRAMESLVKIGSSTIYNVGDEFKDADTDVRLHWVRGHWRRQPFGPRDNPEYRLTWIKPFQRGSEETGQIQARKYDV